MHKLDSLHPYGDRTRHGCNVGVGTGRRKTSLSSYRDVWLKLVAYSWTFAVLLATSEAELQELVDRLYRISRKYSLLINIDKTKVMASNGIACRILIQNELLEQVDTFPYLGSLITEDGECTTEFRNRLNRGQAIMVLLQKIWKYGKVTAYRFQRKYD